MRSLCLVAGCLGLIIGWSSCGGDINVTTAPEVIWTFPVRGAANVRPTDTIKVGFSRVMDASSITNESFSIDGDIGGTTITTGNVAMFVANQDLDFSTTYTVRLTDDIRDTDGIRLDGSYSWSFTTRPPPPTVLQFTPMTGRAGDTITVIGSNFSTSTSGNAVRFNGFPPTGTAPVLSAGSNLLVVVVPVGATSGRLSVTTAGGTAVSSNVFDLIYPGEIWSTGQSGTIRRLNSVAWLNNQCVAVGAVGEILTSEDGLNWVRQQSGTENSLEGITWNGTRMVAVGTGGVILVSPDGRNWSEAESPVDNSLFGITWTGDRFVAVGAAGITLHSPDGAFWTSRPSGVADWLFGVAAHGERVVACGRGGIMIATDNLLSWPVMESGTDLDLLEIVFVDTSFIAVGESGTMLTSPDGVTWTQITLDVANTINDIVLGNTPGGPRWVACGTRGVILASETAAVWEQRSPVTTADLHGVAWTGSRFVVVGSDGAVVVSY